MGLTSLFIDMNSYFASVEQADRPELRGRPVVVAAVNVDSTCCIAASYEAKRLGVKTGTPVWKAKQYRGLRVIEARPELYVKIHQQIVKAVDTCIPVHAVHSIDEMSCRLSPAEREPDVAVELARRIKRAIRERVSPYLPCSIGVAPNRLLAKIATDMQKPDGLIVLNDADLPHALYKLHLQDLPGIGSRMERRLERAGVHTVEQLCQTDEQEMKTIWGGIVGQRWWHWLRGYDLPEPPTHRSTVGHSHVLPPELRTEEGAEAVLAKLIYKCAARLRRMNYWAGRLSVYISFTYREEGWSGSVALGACQDTPTMLEAFRTLWQHRPRLGQPTQVAATLYELTPAASASLPLFPTEQRRVALSRVMDRLNHRFGLKAAYFAGLHDAREAAPMRIAFSRVPTSEDFRELDWT